MSHLAQGSPPTALIIGGGVAGLTLAHLVRQAGWTPILIEKRPLYEMLSGAGGVFLRQNGLSILKQIDDGRLAAELCRQGAPVLHGGFHRQDGAPLYLSNSGKSGKGELGVCIGRADLQRLLYRDLGPEVVRTGWGITDFEQDSSGVRVWLEDGTYLKGDLMVGADGLWSKVRTILEGRDQPAPAEYGGYCCWRGLFKPGQEGLLDPNKSWAEYWGPGQRFGWFHLGGGRYSFYAFSNTAQGGKDDRPTVEVLRELFSDYAEPVPSILAALDGEPIFRDDIYDRPPIEGPWGNGRVTLVGDAAHPVQPNIGQGACQAIEDGFELARALRAATLEDRPVAQALRTFEQSRSKRVERVHKVSRQVGEFARADDKWSVFVRDHLYRWMPNWLGDLQFRWLLEYAPQWAEDQADVA
ncbi:MAG: zeaxanthin epoxidase [Deltaproteobacteria bacterium]|nr:zeaxanthin epoxidase [Deltaproteobacteria bacterium]